MPSEIQFYKELA